MDLIGLLSMFQSQNTATPIIAPIVAKRAARKQENGIRNMYRIKTQAGNCEQQASEESKMSRKPKIFQEEVVNKIGSDRRDRRRYNIDLNVHYKVVHQYQVCQKGTGKTVNFSGGGVAFATGDVLRPGSTVELAIAWPVMLNSTCP